MSGRFTVSQKSAKDGAVQRRSHKDAHTPPTYEPHRPLSIQSVFEKPAHLQRNQFQQ